MIPLLFVARHRHEIVTQAGGVRFMEIDRSAAKAVIEILRRSKFGGLPSSSFASVAELGTIVRLPKRTYVVTQGEHVSDILVIGSGRIIRERTMGGSSLVVGYGGPGDVLGEDAIDVARERSSAGDRAHAISTESARVCEEAEGVVLSIAALERLASQSPPLFSLLLASSHEALRAVEERVFSLLFDPVEARLLAFLKAAAQRWGGGSGAGTLIAAPFTHAEIARSIGSTRETVTLLFGKLKREGIVTFEGRRIVLQVEH